jgi:hypothetical protein
LLRVQSLRHRKIAFSVEVKGRGCLRRFFGKKQRLPLFGGKGYQCLEGHELIALLTRRACKGVKRWEGVHPLWDGFCRRCWI